MENFGERLRLAEQGLYYTPQETEKFLLQFGKPVTHKHRRKEYIDLICAFDTETTSFRNEGVALGTMYAWMFGINGAVMLGRTWEQFEQFIADLTVHFRISLNRRLIVYVHALGFDFQFFRKHFEWQEVFAREERTPMYARTTGGIEFRCSYILTNSSLENVSKNLIRYPVRKLVGTLDYSLIRTWATPLTQTEIQYCLNDVLVLMALIYDRRIAENENIAKIPLTQTGYARRLCRNECLYKHEKAKKYLYLMRDLTLTEDEYITAKQAFAGGFTHASPYHEGEVGFNLESYDFTSSYPAVIVSEMFPMSKGEVVSPAEFKTSADITARLKQNCLLMVLEFKDLKSLTLQEYYISDSRCYNEGANVFNGRVESAKYLRIAVTDVDWTIISKVYSWSSMRVLCCWQYKKRYLPTPYVVTVLDLYKRKTELKGVSGEEENYARAKELLNALYGMMATSIDRPEVIYTEGQEWNVDRTIPLIDVLQKYNTDTRRFISYLWGCYVTAYARRNLWTAIMRLGGDYWYSDTDSVKVSNHEKYKDYFEGYNENIITRLKFACDYHHLPYDYIMPKTIKGKVKPLGVWDDEGKLTRFKTLGAKRYLYTAIEDGKEDLHITCAGVAKKPAVAYLTHKYKTLDAIFEAFEDGLCFPSEYDNDGITQTATGKSTHVYYDKEFRMWLEDYEGQLAPVHELSCVNLSGADYNLGISGAFFEFLKTYWSGQVVINPII